MSCRSCCPTCSHVLEHCALMGSSDLPAANADVRCWRSVQATRNNVMAMSCGVNAQVGAGPEGLDGFGQALQDALQDMKTGGG